MFIVEDPSGKLDREAKRRLDNVKDHEDQAKMTPDDYRWGKLGVELSKKQKRADKARRKAQRKHEKKVQKYEVLRPTG